jgi:hypothetical protein
MLKSLTHRKMIIGDFHVSDKKNKNKHMKPKLLLFIDWYKPGFKTNNNNKNKMFASIN